MKRRDLIRERIDSLIKENFKTMSDLRAQKSGLPWYSFKPRKNIQEKIEKRERVIKYLIKWNDCRKKNNN